MLTLSLCERVPANLPHQQTCSPASQLSNQLVGWPVGDSDHSKQDRSVHPKNGATSTARRALVCVCSGFVFVCFL